MLIQAISNLNIFSSKSDKKSIKMSQTQNDITNPSLFLNHTMKTLSSYNDKAQPLPLNSSQSPKKTNLLSSMRPVKSVNFPVSLMSSNRKTIVNKNDIINFNSNNVNLNRNDKMNKSAILIDKLELELAQELPRYVAGVKNLDQRYENQDHRIMANRRKSIGINKGLQTQGIKYKTMHKILEASIKEAMKITQTSSKKLTLKSSKCLKKNQITPKRPVKKFPRKILNIFYRQNIKNYNPYITILTQLQDPNICSSISQSQIGRIRRLCYMGLARTYFQLKKYFLPPSYSRVGILIRTYMISVTKSLLQQKMQTHPNIFIPINPTALSFNPLLRPRELEQHISCKKFTHIIHTVNKIIEGEYEKYKRGSFQFARGWGYVQIIVYLLLAVVIGCVAKWANGEDETSIQYAGFAAVLAITLGGMFLAWVECQSALGKVCAPNNITSRIEERLRAYFKQISDERLTWKVGPDFYWIQIQNAKIRKKKSDVADIF